MALKIMQSQVWDRISEWWNKFRRVPVPEVKIFLEKKKGRVLDLGCGSGRNIIANSNIKYYGVDFSEEMLKLAEINAKRKNIKAVFFKVDLVKEKLPFKNNFFDSAVFISALHLIETSNARKKALEELFRIVKKNAEVIISVWDKNSSSKLKKIKGKEAYLNWKLEGKDYPRYYYFYDKKELENLLKRTRFKIIKKAEGGKHSLKNLIVYAKK